MPVAHLAVALRMTETWVLEKVLSTRANMTNRVIAPVPEGCMPNEAVKTGQIQGGTIPSAVT